MTSHHPTPAEAWEFRYAESSQRWSGRPNATLVELVGALPPGRALDLGSGEGGDAVWLARQGWTVTGVDISPTAAARAHGAAVEAGVDERARFEAHDLTTWEPVGPYELVAASFFHSQEELARTDILRRAAAAVAPGGHLAIVSHLAPPPWAQLHDHEGGHDHHLLDADGEVAELALGDDWEVVVAEERTRSAVSPSGEPAQLEDVAVLLRRRA